MKLQRLKQWCWHVNKQRVRWDQKEILETSTYKLRELKIKRKCQDGGMGYVNK